MKNCSVAAKQQVLQCKNNIQALEELTVAQKANTISAKAGALAMKALSIAGNMLMFTLVIKGVELLTKGLDKLIVTNEELKESLEESKSSFESATDELESLESELKTTTDRLEELQGLADNNTISIADEKELELLKAQNEELREKIALKKEAQIDEGKDLLKDAKKLANRNVLSSYQYVEGTVEQGSPQYASILPEEELALAFEKYFNPDTLKANDIVPTEVIEEMYPIVEDVIEAYEMLNDAGYELSDSEKAHYAELDALQEKYLLYRYELNGTKETFQALNDEYKKGILVQRLLDKGLSFSQTHLVLDNISVENYDDLWDKDFSFTPPEMTDYATAEEYGRAYATAWLNGVEDGIESGNLFSLNETQTKAIDDFQSKIKTLSTTLSNIRDGSYQESDFTDLVQEFPELQGKSENLEQAITDLVNNSLQKLYDTLGKELPDDVKNSLQAITDAAINVGKELPSLDKAFSAIKKSYDALSNFDKDNITDSMLSSISSLSDELNDLVAGFYAGTVSADELYEALTEHYENDMKNYSEALILKNGNSESFYNAIGIMSSDLVNSFKETYGIDLKNFTDYNKAKAAINTKYLESMSTAWSNYYDIDSSSFKDDALIEKLKQDAKNGDNGAAQELSRIEPILRYHEAMKDLNKIVYNGIESNFKGVSNSLSKSSSSSTSDFSNQIDWAAQSLSVLEDKVSSAQKTLDNSKGYDAQLEAIGELIEAQEALQIGYDKTAETYNKQYETALTTGIIADNGLTKKIRKQIESGKTFSIEDFIDKNVKSGYTGIREALYNAINDAIDWWNKKSDAEKKGIEIGFEIDETKLKELDVQIAQKYDSKLAAFENEKNIIEKQLEKAELRGRINNKKYYQELSRNANDTLEEQKNKLTDLEIVLKNLESQGLSEGSEAWDNYKEQIDDTNLSILELTNSVLKYNKEADKVDRDIFDFDREQESRIMDEADFLIDLIDKQKQIDENGKFTDYGITTVGLRGANYNAYLEQAIKYKAELDKIERELVADPDNTDNIKRRNELLELQQESILSAKSEKEAIADLVSQGFEAQKNALKELIDEYTNALDVQKNLYDQQMKTANQTKKIAQLQKQLAAYTGDKSEETRAKVQQLKVKLDEEQSNLQADQFDRYISDQKEILDSIFTDYEKFMDSRMENIDTLFEKAMAEANLNTSTISSVISEEVKNVGYEINTGIDGAFNSITEGKSSLSTDIQGVESQIENDTSVITNSQNAETQRIVEKLDKNDVTQDVENINKDTKDTKEKTDDISDNTDSIKSKFNILNTTVSSISTILNRISTTIQTISTKIYSLSSKSSSSPSGTSSGKTSSSSNGSVNFIKKVDTYDKSKLNTQYSIEDLLRYNDFDSSQSARAGYYSQMGYSDIYKGTAEQNRKMIAWMIQHGYKGYAKGGYNLKKQTAWTQENGLEYILRPSDGAILTPLAKGDSVLNAEASKNIWDMANMPGKFIMENLTNIAMPDFSKLSASGSIRNEFGDISINIPLENVTDVNSFLREFQSNPKVEAIIKDVMANALGNGSSFAKYRHKF